MSSELPFSLPAGFLHHLKEASTIVLCAHYRPDGDAIGSTLAFGLALQEAGKTVWMINEDSLPSLYQFLEGSSQLLAASSLEKVPEDTLFIALDCATEQRLGEAAIALKKKCAFSLNIDHHESNHAYGDLNLIVPELPATGMIIFELIKELGLPLIPEVRDALYVAISTDTGSFQYQGTTAHTMRAVAHLLELGAPVAELCQRIYNEQPYRKTLLTQALLDSLVLEDEGRIAYLSLTNETKEKLGILPDDTEGLINLARCIEGVKVALFFEEIENDTRIRISLRSKDPRINVSAFAQLFGGGGHPMAAGVRMRGPLQEAQTRLLSSLKETLTQSLA